MPWSSFSECWALSQLFLLSSFTFITKLSSSSSVPQFKTINSSALCLLYGPAPTAVHDYWKNHSFDYMDHSFDYMDLCWQIMSLHFNMLSRLVITFLPRSKRVLISWLQSPSAMILEPRKIKSDTVSTVSPSISPSVSPPWSGGTGCHVLLFLNVEL